MSELRAVEDLQKEVWGCNDREILPSLALVPLLEIGGVLLGAFAGVEVLGFALRVGEHTAPVCMEYPGGESSVIEIPVGIDSLVETEPALARVDAGCVH